MSDEVFFFDAYEQVLSPLFAASNVLQLIARAERSGLLHRLRDGADVAALTQVTGLPEHSVQTLCRALAVTGVVEAYEGGHRLTPPWRALTDPGAYVPLATALGGAAIEARLIGADRGETYWTMSTEERVTYARSVSPDPYSDELVEAFAAEIAGDPDRSPMLDGGRLLELGCGVAGRVLTTLRAAPKLTAVGVELSPDLAEEAQRRAVDLGLTDRFRIVCADAADYRCDEPFDFGFWSQFFFPSDARGPALRTMLRCLRPGGVLHAPLGANFEEMASDPHGDAARDFAVWRVVLDAWGVPERSPDALVAEFAAAGFGEVRVAARKGGGPVVRGIRP